MNLRMLIPVSAIFSSVVAVAGCSAQTEEGTEATTASALRQDGNNGNDKGGKDNNCDPRKDMRCAPPPKDDGCDDKKGGKGNDCCDDKKGGKGCDDHNDGRDRNNCDDHRPPKGDDDDDDHGGKDHGGRTW